MKVELPATRPYSASFTVGSRIEAGQVQEIGTIIVKASYLLIAAEGADTHQLVSDPDAAASGLLLADQGHAGADGFDVSREADMAPYKPVSDVVVEGFRASFVAGAELRVDGTVWLTRSEPAPALSAFFLADRERNLFGYQPRSLTPRVDEAGDPLAGPVPDPPTFPLRELARLDDLVGYDNRALNFHRRGGGFVASAAVASSLRADQRICLHRLDTDQELFAVTLVLPALHALYRTYCGHGPDKPSYWTRIRLGAMRADTLVLRPDAGRAEVVWRASWPWRDQPTERYRALRVSEGSS